MSNRPTLLLRRRLFLRELEKILWIGHFAHKVLAESDEVAHLVAGVLHAQTDQWQHLLGPLLLWRFCVLDVPFLIDAPDQILNLGLEQLAYRLLVVNCQACSLELVVEVNIVHDKGPDRLESDGLHHVVSFLNVDDGHLSDAIVSCLSKGKRY